jgi:hypothetical protein
MKRIRLVGFRGTGDTPPYQAEDGLIQLGHVGICFEGDEIIYGFHPTQAAIVGKGGVKAAIEYLKHPSGGVLRGKLYDDTEIFHRADYLCTRDPKRRTAVWQVDEFIEDQRFDALHKTVKEWYSNNVEFNYALPGNDPTACNCATFPDKHLGLTIPEPTGRMQLYVKEMQENGELWSPNS